MDEYANIMAEDSEIQEPIVPVDPTEQTPTPIEEITKGEIQGETIKVEAPIDSDGTNPDETGTIYVPGGYGISTDSPNDINDGIVITNANNSKQFVWIPVGEEELGEMYVEAPGTELSKVDGMETKTTDVYSKLRDSSDGTIIDTNKYKPGSTSLREPDILTDTSSGDASTESGYGVNLIKEVFGEELGVASETDTNTILNAFSQMLIDEYEETYASIKKYGGFYIGRYEISGSVESPTLKQGGTVLVNENWYALKKACNNIENSEYAKSEMIYGNQWDRVLNWLVETGAKKEEEVYSDSSSWGNYRESTGDAATNAGSLQTSGKNEAWQANNIYDLAGNALDWTQEAGSPNLRVNRGGFCYNFGYFLPASYRYDNDSSVITSARPALYVGL